MAEGIDLSELARRESEQVEWKENVADFDDVVATLCAFANDLQNLGGGYVVCGAAERSDEHGFPRLLRIGLTAARLRSVEDAVLGRCKDRVSPPITPEVAEIAADNPSRRILVFVQRATGKAHTFRRGREGPKHYIRVSRSTTEARDATLQDLLIRKRAIEAWDRRPCAGATLDDVDLLALRDALQRMGMFSADVGLEPYLIPDIALSPFVPSLMVMDSLTSLARPRNYAILLFGRQPQRFIPGAVSIFSIYPGRDRSDPHAERHELAGNILDQARRLRELLDIHSYTAFDKNDPGAPNAIKYPRSALYEVLGNALAHRDYELSDPARLTVFSDRIEVVSPGPLPGGVDLNTLRQGKAHPRWRNQSLAWFFSRLDLAQAEGQGIPTILSTMSAEGNPPPKFEADEARVYCALPAHPRHETLRELRHVEQALTLGEIEQAKATVEGVLARDPLNFRAIQLFAEVQHARQDHVPVVTWVRNNQQHLDALPSQVHVQLAEALTTEQPTKEERELARELLARAARGRLDERQTRRVVVVMNRAWEHARALELIEQQLLEHPEWQHNPSLRQLRGNALIGMANKAKRTATSGNSAIVTRERAWKDFRAYLANAESELRGALADSVDEHLNEQIQRNIEYLLKLKKQGRK